MRDELRASEVAVTAGAISKQTMSTVGVVIPPPLVYVAAVLVGIGIDTALPPVAVPGVARWVGGGLFIVAGLGLAGAFFRAFRRAGTPVDLRKPTSRLVTSGPYRLTRNPGYLSLTILSAGLAVALDAAWAIIAVAIAAFVVDRTVVRREEEYLRNLFGAQYEEYVKATRRWL